MADLTIVAGEVGRGGGVYDTGLFSLPDGSVRGAETIAEVVIHGGVDKNQSLVGHLIGGLRGGVALASHLDLTAPVNLAAAAIGSGLNALDNGPRQSALIEVKFLDGATFVAMADVGISSLMENDRRVIQAAVPRLHPIPVQASTELEAGLATRAVEAASSAVGSAGSAVSSAFGFIKSRTLG